jgi:hypothetical protein
LRNFPVSFTILGMISRFFGWVFLFVAAAVLVRDVFAWRTATPEAEFSGPESLIGLWADLSSSSLGIFRADVLHTMPWLWNYLLAPALSLWAVPVLFVLSMALFWSARAAAARRRKHH